MSDLQAINNALQSAARRLGENAATYTTGDWNGRQHHTFHSELTAHRQAAFENDGERFSAARTLLLKASAALEHTAKTNPGSVSWKNWQEFESELVAIGVK